jgi:hypothetical protein
MTTRLADRWETIAAEVLNEAMELEREDDSTTIMQRERLLERAFTLNECAAELRKSLGATQAA